MSELQFPKDPVVGQEYDFSPYKYYWDGVKWKAVAGHTYAMLNMNIDGTDVIRSVKVGAAGSGPGGVGRMLYVDE